MSLTLPHKITPIACSPQKVHAWIADPKSYTILNPACVQNDLPATTTATTSSSQPADTNNNTTIVKWKATEQPSPQFLGLYNPKVPLDIIATVHNSPDAQGWWKVTHNIVPDVGFGNTGKMRVRIEYKVRGLVGKGEEEEESSSMIEDTIIITAPWLLRVFSKEPASRIQRERVDGIKGALEEL